MSLLPALVAGADLPSALVAPDGTFSRHDLLGWAASIAGDIAGAPIVAVDAVPGAATVAAVAGALLAGVPIVPVPPDAGRLEREHVLRDSGAAQNAILRHSKVQLCAPSARCLFPSFRQFVRHLDGDAFAEGIHH